LSGLVHGSITPDVGTEAGLTEARWRELHDERDVVTDEAEVHRLVYFGGVAHDIRKEVWPYLLAHYSFGQTPDERKELDETTRHYYETTMSEWLAVEAIVRQLDKEKTAHAVAKLSSGGSASDTKGKNGGVDVDVEMENEVFEENGFSDLSEPEMDDEHKPMDVDVPKSPSAKQLSIVTSDKIESIKSSPSTSSYETVGTDFVDFQDKENGLMSPKLNPTAVIVTDASIDIVNLSANADEKMDEGDGKDSNLEPVHEEMSPTVHNSLDALQEPKSACVSPASSNGGIYSVSRSRLGLSNQLTFTCRLNCWNNLDSTCIASKRTCSDAIATIGTLPMRTWTS